MIIGYLRVSTGKQNPENQKDEIRRYLEAKNSNVDQWVIETVSGNRGYRHPWGIILRGGILSENIFLGQIIHRIYTGEVSQNLTLKYPKYS